MKMKNLDLIAGQMGMKSNGKYTKCRNSHNEHKQHLGKWSETNVHETSSSIMVNCWRVARAMRPKPFKIHHIYCTLLRSFAIAFCLFYLFDFNYVSFFNLLRVSNQHLRLHNVNWWTSEKDVFVIFSSDFFLFFFVGVALSVDQKMQHVFFSSPFSAHLKLIHLDRK